MTAIVRATHVKLAAGLGFLLASIWLAAPAPAAEAPSSETAPPDTVIDSTFSERGDYRTFRFYASTPDSTFECSLDGAAAEPCSSPHTYLGLSDGRHSLSVRAIDSGSADPSPAFRRFTVDTKLSSPWIRVRDMQRQKATRVKVKVRAGAGEAGSVQADGAVKIGGQSFNLKKEYKAIAAGRPVLIRLVAQKQQEARRIHRLLDRGKKVRAYVRVGVFDVYDNAFRRLRVVRLR